MGLLDRISYTMDAVKKQKEDRELKRALELKALREKAIPMFQRLLEKYHGAQVKYLDTDAYVFVVEDGKERGTYIPYAISEIQLDLKLDTFVHNYTSASRHKMHARLEHGLDSIDSNNKKSSGFWSADLDIKSFDTSLNRRH
jgi:hypothetical protein